MIAQRARAHLDRRILRNVTCPAIQSPRMRSASRTATESRAGQPHDSRRAIASRAGELERELHRRELALMTLEQLDAEIAELRRVIESWEA